MVIDFHVFDYSYDIFSHIVLDACVILGDFCQNQKGSHVGNVLGFCKNGQKFNMEENIDVFIIINDWCISLTWGTKSLIYTKIVMYVFGNCYCGKGMLSADCPAGLDVFSSDFVWGNVFIAPDWSWVNQSTYQLHHVDCITNDPSYVMFCMLFRQCHCSVSNITDDVVL